jgi:hypothetical protein
VHISNDLQIKVSLNGTPITSKVYPGDFAANKQVKKFSNLGPI